MRIRHTDYEQVSHRGELVEVQLKIALLRRHIEHFPLPPEDSSCPPSALSPELASSDSYVSDSPPADSLPAVRPPRPRRPWWQRWIGWDG